MTNFSPAGLWILFHVITSVFGLITQKMWQRASLRLSPLLSICTAVHSHSHDSILLTHIAEQIVNRFHSNLFACLSIISPCTVSYCICVYMCSVTKFLLALKGKGVRVFFFFFYSSQLLFFFFTSIMAELLGDLLAKDRILLVDEPEHPPPLSWELNTSPQNSIFIHSDKSTSPAQKNPQVC